MNDRERARYDKIRARTPLMPIANALRWAKTENPGSGWEEASGHVTYEREVDGFTITLRLCNESIYPMPKDGLGEYVNDARADYSYNWQGEYPMPAESFPLGLPYTAFRYHGPGWVQGEGTGYFVPEGVEDQFNYFHRDCGQSRSVARDLTHAWVVDTLRSFFQGPLTYCTIVVTASRNGVELGSDSIGTNYIDDFADDIDGRSYIFTCAEENGLITSAIEDAESTLEGLCSCED